MECVTSPCYSQEIIFTSDIGAGYQRRFWSLHVFWNVLLCSLMDIAHLQVFRPIVMLVRSNWHQWNIQRRARSCKFYWEYSHRTYGFTLALRLAPLLLTLHGISILQLPYMQVYFKIKSVNVNQSICVISYPSISDKVCSSHVTSCFTCKKDICTLHFIDSAFSSKVVYQHSRQ